MKAEMRLLEPSDARWREFLSATRHDFYHLPGYAEVCAAQQGGEARALYVEIGAHSLLLPLIFRRIEGTDLVDATSPYGYPGPLTYGTDDASVATAALRYGVAALRQLGVVSLFVRSHPLLNDRPPHGIGHVVRHADTVSIDLRLSPEELVRQLRPSHRHDIRNATTLGIEAQADPAFAQLDSFKRVYRATMERREASHIYYFTDEYFARLRAALGPRLHLLVATVRGEVAAAGLFVENDAIVEYHLAGAADAYVRSGASKLLVHAASTWAKARGNRVLHLGGGVGAADDTLLQFKRGFSPLRHPFWTLRAVIDEAAYARLRPTDDRGVEPTGLDGYFPSYRAS